jgi:hypothetical protein
MDILGGSPEVKLLPDSHSLHLLRHISKWLLIVQCSNSQNALLFHFPHRLERGPGNGDNFVPVAAVAMTREEERELREQLARLQQEHRDLDAAISALQHSPGADLLQVQRLKKRKLYLRDRIAHIEDELTPDIIA